MLFGWELGQYFAGGGGDWVLPDPGWVYLPGCEGEYEIHSPTVSGAGCINNQAGVWPGDPAPPPYVIQRAVTGRRRWGVGYYRESNIAGRVTHVRSYYKDYFPPHPAAAPTEIKPVDDVPYIAPPKPAVHPWARLGWAPWVYPELQPVSPPFITEPDTPPLGVPRPENPGTPQWPERWNDKPDTVPFPGLEPYVPPVPVSPIVPNPEGGWQTNPEASQMPDGETVLRPRGQASSQPRPNRKPKRPPRGTKERKVHLRGAAAALWRSFSAPTEFADFVEVLYKSLPFEIRRDVFFKLRRPPKTLEQMQLVYKHINKVDMPAAVRGYIENQVEDFVLGSIGQLEAEANQRNPFRRPLGYGAGFAL